MAELALLGRYREIPETLFFARVASQGSGNLESAESQQAFVDTSATKSPRFARLRFLQGYLDAVSRSAPSWIDAMRCRLAILRWLLQVSKWRYLIVKAMQGQGVGGRNVERINRLNSRNDHATTGSTSSAATGHPPGLEAGHDA